MFLQINHCLAILDNFVKVFTIKSVINYPLTHTHRNLEIFNGKPIERESLV